MKKQKTAKTRPSFRPGLFILAAVVFAFLLEIGKHTLAGWILTAVLLAAYAFFRLTRFRELSRGKKALARLGLVAVFSLILLISWPPMKRVPAVDAARPEETGVVTVAQGRLTGVYTKDRAVEVYAGIPYAEPPVGELRWKEPQPAGPWEGVLKADHFGPMSMQTVHSAYYDSVYTMVGYHDYRISLRDNYRPAVSEDSLYLNVWKPAGEQKDLPVLVYIHGGSLQTGQPWFADYSGEGLAREGIVVVNMAYRLGVFGFFADAELAAESPNGSTGNYGLLDQIEALRWVQANIAAFGGDPGNVTVAGESAGSACVTALCTSPLAKGLFRRVTAESSTVTAPEPAHSFRLMDEALAAGAATKKRFSASSVSDLRKVPAEKIVSELNSHHHMTVDGYALTETPYESYAKGIHNEEAQFMGFNSKESAPFILFQSVTTENYPKMIRSVFPEELAKRVLALYPYATNAEARKAWAEVFSALFFVYGHFCWQRQATENGVPTYVYYFTKENGRLGPWHSGEEIYLYRNIPERSLLFNSRDRELSLEMSGYFLNFIRTGDPNGAGLPVWEAGSDAYRVMEFGETTGMTDFPYREMSAILDELQHFGSAEP